MRSLLAAAAALWRCAAIESWTVPPPARGGGGGGRAGKSKAAKTESSAASASSLSSSSSSTAAASSLETSGSAGTAPASEAADPSGLVSATAATADPLVGWRTQLGGAHGLSDIQAFRSTLPNDEAFELLEIGDGDLALASEEWLEDHRLLAHLSLCVPAFAAAAPASSSESAPSASGVKSSAGKGEQASANGAASASASAAASDSGSALGVAWACQPADLSIAIPDVLAAGRTPRGRRWSRRVQRSWEVLCTAARVCAMMAAAASSAAMPAALSASSDASNASTASSSAGAGSTSASASASASAATERVNRAALLARQKAAQIAASLRIADAVDVHIGGALAHASLGVADVFDEILGGGGAEVDANELLLVKRAENDYDLRDHAEVQASAAVLVLLSDLRRRRRMRAGLPRFLQAHASRQQHAQQTPAPPAPTPERWLLDLLPSLEPAELFAAACRS